MPAACLYLWPSVPKAQQISSHSRRDVPQAGAQAQQRCGSSGRSNFNLRKTFAPAMTGLANTAPGQHHGQGPQRDFLPWVPSKVTYSLTSADKHMGQGEGRGDKTERLGSSSKDQNLLLQEPMLPCQCGRLERSCRHGRPTKLDKI